jgi:hypothetical protein
MAQSFSSILGARMSDVMVKLLALVGRGATTAPLLAEGLAYSDIADLMGRAEDLGYLELEGESLRLTRSGKREIERQPKGLQKGLWIVKQKKLIRPDGRWDLMRPYFPDLDNEPEQ